MPAVCMMASDDGPPYLGKVSLGVLARYQSTLVRLVGVAIRIAGSGTPVCVLVLSQLITILLSKTHTNKTIFDDLLLTLDSASTNRKITQIGS